MNYRDLKKARIGSRVAFTPLPGDAGEPAEGVITGFSPSKNKATVEWSDGEISIINDASYDRISLLPEAAPITADLENTTATTINELREAFARGELKKGEQPTDRRQTPNGGRRP